MDPKTHDTAVFFGLSGTGKTTLSADPKRLLIGDDEHGWAMGEGIFNIEGGCYAKCDGLTEEREPEIFRAVKFGALCEKRHPRRQAPARLRRCLPLTQNTRVGYPVEHIPNSCLEGAGGEPTAVIFLTCDAFGVLPPISRLSADAAMYHFVSGFTSKVAGTELGIKGARPHLLGPVRRALHAARPHGLRRHARRADRRGKTRVYLVNTGWVEGSYGVGHRIPLVYNRINVNAALDGTLEEAEFIHDDVFNLDIPTSCPGVPRRSHGPVEVLVQQGGVRRHGQEARGDVPGELREEVRSPAREREKRRTARLIPPRHTNAKEPRATHLHEAPSLWIRLNRCQTSATAAPRRPCPAPP